MSSSSASDQTAPEISFLSKQSRSRAQSGIKNNLLAKAIGLKKGHRPFVIDATAGLGRDAHLLSQLGCTVHMIERSPLIAAQLKKAMAQANTDPAFAKLDLTLFEASATDHLKQYLPENHPKQPPDVIYLDPMHPERTKSALVKKPMRQLKAIVGNDEDAPALLQMALATATARVVVKRPRLAPPLPGPTPTTTLTGKTIRFDIYSLISQSSLLS